MNEYSNVMNEIEACKQEAYLHSGECGECSWGIDDSGVLSIWPTDGEEGKLAGPDFPHTAGVSDIDDFDFIDVPFELSAVMYWPWGKYVKSIKAVRIAGRIKLPAVSKYMFSCCSSLVESQGHPNR